MKNNDLTNSFHFDKIYKRVLSDSEKKFIIKLIRAFLDYSDTLGKDGLETLSRFGQLTFKIQDGEIISVEAKLRWRPSEDDQADEVTG